MAEFDLGGLMKASGEQAALIANTQKQMSTMADQTAEAGDAMAAAVRAGSVDKEGNTVLSIQTAALGKLDAQKNRDAYRIAIGDDPTSAARLSLKLADNFAQAALAVQDQAKVVAEKQSVGLFDNPLQFLVNQITLPDENNKLAGLKTQEVAASFAAKEMQAMMSAQAKVESEYSKTLSEASIDSLASAAKNDLEAKAQQARISALASNAHMLQNVMSAGQTQLQNLNRVIEARNSAEHLAMARETHSNELKKFATWEQDNKDKKEFEEQLVGFYNEGAKQAGRAPLGPAQIKTLRQIDPKQFQEFVELGYANTSTGMSVLGTSPARVVAFSNAAKIQLPPDIQAVYDGAYVRVKSDPLLDKKDGAAVGAAINKEVKRTATELQAIPDWTAASNPYVLATPKVLGTSPNVAKTALWQKILAPQVEQGLNTSDPNRIVSLGIEAVTRGDITPKELSDGLVRYYTTGMSANNAQRQFNKHALPEATQVKARLELPGASPFGVLKAETDMTDSTSVNNYIAKRLVSLKLAGSGMWR